MLKLLTVTLEMHRRRVAQLVMTLARSAGCPLTIPRPPGLGAAMCLPPQGASSVCIAVTANGLASCLGGSG